MTPAWKQYQEETAAFFRSLGLDASTDVTLEGVRTNHDIDVVVNLTQAGFTVRWIVECKHWKDRVSKLHVIALRQIVIETGSDRGIILCEAGFQSGAIEAANLTNVRVASLATLKSDASDAVYAVKVRDLFDRAESCRERYWEIPKDVRIEKGLRSHGGGYSGARVTDFAREVLSRALRGTYPFEYWGLENGMDPALPSVFSSHKEVFEVIEPLVADLESRLAGAGF